MTIQTCVCECGREFMINEDYGSAGRCAVCVARDGRCDGDLTARYLEYAKVQQLADIKVALFELVDVLDKWRP